MGEVTTRHMPWVVLWSTTRGEALDPRLVKRRVPGPRLRRRAAHATMLARESSGRRPGDGERRGDPGPHDPRMVAIAAG